MITATDITVRQLVDGNFNATALAWRDGVASFNMQSRFTARVVRMARRLPCTANQLPEGQSEYMLRNEQGGLVLQFQGTDATAKKVLREYMRAVGQLCNVRLVGYLAAVAILNAP